MSGDRKRINGPENTVPYQLYTKLNTKTLKQQFHGLFKPDSSRIDGRKHSEHRKTYLKTDVISTAKGSAYIEVDETKVIVSVFDPREIPNKSDYSPKGELYCEFKFATFSCPKRKLHQLQQDEQQYSAILKQALESAVCRHEFPNFQVDVYALVLHNDGSAVSATITAAAAALAHAGIPMYDLVTSVTIGIQGKTRLVDPTLKEEILCAVPLSMKKTADADEENHGVIIASMLHNHEQVSQFYQIGNLSLKDLSESIDVVGKACKDIVPLVQKCLAKDIARTIAEKNTPDEDMN